mgnify:CR=1 FL=1
MAMGWISTGTDEPEWGDVTGMSEIREGVYDPSSVQQNPYANLEQTIQQLMSGSYRMSREDAARYAPFLQKQFAGGQTLTVQDYALQQELLDKYDPGRGGGTFWDFAMGATGLPGSESSDLALGLLSTPPGMMIGGVFGAAALGAGAAGAGAGTAATAGEVGGAAAAGEAGAGIGTAASGSAPFIAPEALAAGTALGTGAAGGGLTLAEAAAAASLAETATQRGDAYDPATGGGSGGYDAPGPGGTGFEPPGTAAPPGSPAYQSAISRIIDGTATTADWVFVLGTAGATGLGTFSANQRSNSLEKLAEQNRAERAPFLGAATNWLNNPEAYWSGPGQASLDANLRRLSASHGNPISSPTALGIASKAGLMDWRDAVTGFGNMGLSGADTRANLGIGAAGAQADIWGNLAGGISDIVNPRRSLADVMKEYSLMVGGARV